MVHFIMASNSDTSVEEVMGYVNNYINLNELENIEYSSDAYVVKREFDTLKVFAERINRDYRISASRPNIIMAEGRFKKLKILLKRIIRKLINGYLSDLAEQQTQFNADVTKMINQELEVIVQMNQELRNLREYNADVTRKMNQMNQELRNIQEENKKR